MANQEGDDGGDAEFLADAVFAYQRRRRQQGRPIVAQGAPASHEQPGEAAVPAQGPAPTAPAREQPRPPSRPGDMGPPTYIPVRAKAAQRPQLLPGAAVVPAKAKSGPVEAPAPEVGRRRARQAPQVVEDSSSYAQSPY